MRAWPWDEESGGRRRWVWREEWWRVVARRRGESRVGRRRRCGGGAEAWGEWAGAAAARQRARQRVRPRAGEQGWGRTLLRPSGAATLTGLISNMMHTASMVSLTPAGGDFMLLTSVMSSRLSVLSAFTDASSAGMAWLG